MYKRQEEERAFLGKQISAVSLGNERRRKQIALLRQDEKDEMEREQSRLLAGEAEEKALRLRLAAMEEYWEELEADYSCRERTIGWLRGLSGGKNGMDELLNSLKMCIRDRLDGEAAYSEAYLVVIAVPTNYDSKRNFFDTSAVESVIHQVVSCNQRAVLVIKSRCV